MAGIVRRVGRVTTLTGTVVLLLLTATVAVAAATPPLRQYRSDTAPDAPPA